LETPIIVKTPTTIWEEWRVMYFI